GEAVPCGARRGARRPVAELVSALRLRRATEFLFLATMFCITFEKVHWNVAGNVSLADVLTILFLVAFVLSGNVARPPRTVAIVLAFFCVFLLVYLVGFYNLQTHQALDQFGKGMVKFVLHFLFLAVGIAYLAPRLALTPVCLRRESAHRRKWTIAPVLAFLLAVDVVTLSRSGWLGLVVGVLVLLVPYRRLLVSRALVAPLAGVAVVFLYVLYTH